MTDSRLHITSLIISVGVVMIAAGTLVRAGEASTSATKTNSMPNIVLIYADDLGYGDVQCYNPERGKIPTPHIDRLASEGMRFTDAHSSSGVCSPSRYTLLTGRYHWRTRLQRGIVGLWGSPLIARDRLTIAGMLHSAGYRTAAIGKWHLGWSWQINPDERFAFKRAAKKAEATEKHRTAWKRVFNQPILDGPTTRGFDSYFGTAVPNWPPYCFIENNRTTGVPQEYLPPKLLERNQASIQGPALSGWELKRILPTLTDRVVAFIENASKKQTPYFLYFPLTSPHTPLAVNEAFKGKSGLDNAYADLVIETDAMIGRVMKAIEKSGEADRTLVIFTSDNGCAPYIGKDKLEERGHYPSGPLRGAKSDAWEGGHRVPFIVRWPGAVAPGAVCTQLVHQADIIRTCAALTGYQLPANAAEDSCSLLPLLRGKDRPVRTNAVSASMNGLSSLRRGGWKLIFGKGSGGWTKGSDDQPGQLYNLAEDIAEQNNLYNEKSGIVKELTKLMKQLVEKGRSTPGPKQQNDVKINWNRIK